MEEGWQLGIHRVLCLQYVEYLVCRGNWGNEGPQYKRKRTRRRKALALIVFYRLETALCFWGSGGLVSPGLSTFGGHTMLD